MRCFILKSLQSVESVRYYHGIFVHKAMGSVYDDEVFGESWIAISGRENRPIANKLNKTLCKFDRSAYTDWFVAAYFDAFLLMIDLPKFEG